MTTYTATAPNGKVFTRNTKNTYTHAAAIASADGSDYQVISFHSTRELALKAANDLINGWNKWATHPKTQPTARPYYEEKAAKWTAVLAIEVVVAA